MSMKNGHLEKTPDNHRAIIQEIFGLRNALTHAHEKHDVSSSLLVSLEPGMGTTTVSIALALGLCWDRKTRVTIVDANFQRPTLHEAFNLPIEEGLREFLAGENGICHVMKKTGVPNLRVVSCGDPALNPEIQYERFPLAMEELKTVSDFILIDSAAISTNPQAYFWSSYFDCITLVVEANKVENSQLNETLNQFKHAQAKILGVVMNREKNLKDNSWHGFLK